MFLQANTWYALRLATADEGLAGLGLTLVKRQATIAGPEPRVIRLDSGHYGFVVPFLKPVQGFDTDEIKAATAAGLIGATPLDSIDASLAGAADVVSSGGHAAQAVYGAAAARLEAARQTVTEAVQSVGVAAGTALAIPASVMVVGGVVALALIVFWLNGGAKGAKPLVAALKGA